MSRCPVQVISPIEATGVVEVVSGLDVVQDKTYDTPTVLIAEQVGNPAALQELPGLATAGGVQRPGCCSLRLYQQT